MKNFLCAFAAIAGIYGVSIGMELESVNWSEVAGKTRIVSEITPSEMAMRSLRGDISVDWGTIQENALDGDPVAQYCMALKCDRDSKLSYNGRKKNLQFAMSMFVLIASQKGKYEQATSDLARYMPLLDHEINFSDAKAVTEFVEQFIQSIGAK